MERNGRIMAYNKPELELVGAAANLVLGREKSFTTQCLSEFPIDGSTDPDLW